MSGGLEELKPLILKHALKNALEHDGKAMVGPVMSRVLGERPDLRSVARKLVSLVRRAVDEVNQMSLDEQLDMLRKLAPELLEERRVEEEKRLPPLPDVDKYEEVRTRFAPNPDFVLTLGNARPAILSYEYAKMYDGKFILRFEDTDPKTKPPILEAYELIKDDLRWLGISWDVEVIQSQRMPLYYEIARRLIEVGGAYVCTCDRAKFKALRDSGTPCPHRAQSVDENLKLWGMMLEGEFGEGEAVLRVKTDLAHPDPSIRDWVAFRIIDVEKHPHPLTGTKYHVWPTYNFACGVDDHELGVTHILRAREHVQNTVKQTYMYKHLGWRYPTAIHFGRLRFKGFVLSKSKIRRLLESGGFEGYDDPRFATLRALRRRGFQPEALRQLMIEVGVKPSDATISMENLAAINRKILDLRAPRLMFVPNPVELRVKGVDRIDVNIPLHPSSKALGSRRIAVKGSNGEVRVLVSASDLSLFRAHKVVRLMGAMNLRPMRVERETLVCEYIGDSLAEAKRAKAPIIQWAPINGVKTVVRIPEGLKIVEVTGVSEPYVMEIGVDKVVQFVRFGFARIDRVEMNTVIAYFAHT